MKTCFARVRSQVDAIDDMSQSWLQGFTLHFTLICFPLSSGARKLGLQVRAGSFLAQWLVIEPIPF